MKERIKLEKHELYKLIDCLPMPMITDEDLEKEIKEGRKIVLFGKERKIEKVPETFEELKELCKELEGKKIITTSTGIIIEDDCIEFHGLQFWKSGTISHETEIDKGLAIRLNRTPQQMWNIIKSLVGEE